MRGLRRPQGAVPQGRGRAAVLGHARRPVAAVLVAGLVAVWLVAQAGGLVADAAAKAGGLVIRGAGHPEPLSAPLLRCAGKPRCHPGARARPARQRRGSRRCRAARPERRGTALRGVDAPRPDRKCQLSQLLGWLDAEGAPHRRNRHAEARCGAHGGNRRGNQTVADVEPGLVSNRHRTAPHRPNRRQGLAPYFGASDLAAEPLAPVEIDKALAWLSAADRVGAVYLLAGTGHDDFTKVPQTDAIQRRMRSNVVAFAGEYGRYADFQMVLLAAVAKAQMRAISSGKTARSRPMPTRSGSSLPRQCEQPDRAGL